MNSSRLTIAHARLLCTSYRHWTGRDLAPPEHDTEARVRFLDTAAFALVSHGLGGDPGFNYGNATALRLFEMDAAAFTRLPSRLSAAPVDQATRDVVMAQVTARGFLDAYDGVRVSASGRRFRIEGATIWNLTDDAGAYCGQAARFDRWTFLG